jgi:hypothetical protein
MYDTICQDRVFLCTISLSHALAHPSAGEDASAPRTIAQMPHPSVLSVSELRGLREQKRIDALVTFGLGAAELDSLWTKY